MMGGNPGGDKGAPIPRKLVCDTSVLLAGGDPRGSPDDEVFVTPSVINEVKRPEDRERLQTLREIGLKPSTRRRRQPGTASGYRLPTKNCSRWRWN